MEAHLDGGQHRYSDLPQKMWDVVILPVAEVGIHEIHVLCQRVHCWINLPGEGDSESVGVGEDEDECEVEGEGEGVGGGNMVGGRTRSTWQKRLQW